MLGHGHPFPGLHHQCLVSTALLERGLRHWVQQMLRSALIAMRGHIHLPLQPQIFPAALLAYLV